MTASASSHFTASTGIRTGQEIQWFGKALFKETANRLQSDKMLYLLIAVIWVGGFCFLKLLGHWDTARPLLYISILLPLLGYILPLLMMGGIWVTIVKRSGKRKTLGYKMAVTPRNLSRFTSGVILATAFCLFMGMFTAIKYSLGVWLGFLHDTWQADLDKFLFFQHDPWRVLFEPLHHTVLQQIIEVNYNVVWHLTTFTAFSAAIYLSSSFRFRQRYVSCFILTWFLLGNIFAGIFISAGPAYYGLVTGDETRFGSQLQMLAQYADSTAVEYQKYLWSSYTSGVVQFGSGISAFPSVHVGVTVLNALFAFEFSRRLGIVAALYSLFVWYSSIFLAWHYAVDGLFSAIVVGVIYTTVRKLVCNAKTTQTAAS